MNAELLLAHYHRIADAPDAVQRLRRFILDLAVRGKLVAQDPKDEPASELLKLIAKEKLLRTNGRSRGRTVKIRPLPEAAGWFAPPSGWVWAAFGDIVVSRDGERIPVSKEERNGRAKLFDYYGASGVIDKIDNYIFDKPLLLIGEDGANLINRSTPIAFIARGKYWVNNHAHVLDGLSVELLRYVELFVNAIDLKPYVTGAAQPKMNQAKMNSIPVALPPLAEQHRIVAKVDELMALCDRLEAARAAREATRDRLAAASLARLNAPDPDPAVFRSHAGFALDNVAAITARADQVKQLRQTILNLAMRGKLVQQDADDESGADLLNRVHQGRKFKRRFAQIAERELAASLPPLPRGWTWATVDQISDDAENAITDGPFGSQLKTEHYITAAGFRVIRLQNVGGGFFRSEYKSYIDQGRFEQLSKHHIKAGDLVVAGLVDPAVRCCQIPSDIGPAVVKADCYRLSVHPRFVAKFALYFLNSPLAEEFAAVHHHGMTLTRIGLGNFRKTPFPVPPCAEQHRIVAKIDELMGLCDCLEASLASGGATRRRLLDALLSEALSPREDIAA